MPVTPTKSNQKNSETEKLVLRSYKLFNDTILQTSSFVSNDFVFATGVGGNIYKLSKRDYCKLMVK